MNQSKQNKAMESKANQIMVLTIKDYLRCYIVHYLFILLLLPYATRNDWSSTTTTTTASAFVVVVLPSSVKMISSLRRKERRHHYPSIHCDLLTVRNKHQLQWNLLMVNKDDPNVLIDINEQQKHLLLVESMKQQFAESFDRWRFLQNFLDDDDNNTVDPSLILLLLQTLVRQKQSQLQQQELEPSTATSLRLIESMLLDDNKSSNEEKDSNTIITGTTTTIATTMNDESDKDTTRITKYIMNDLSIVTLQKLLQPTELTTDEVLLLQQIESKLLPNPVEDEDAHKGLWDTIIELHGRESVKINERNASKANSSGGWKTRCLISRLLIHYDFLSNGITIDTP